MIISIGSAFTILSILYNLIFTIVYNLKSRINTKENRIYKILLAVTLAGSVCGFLCYLGVKDYRILPIFALIISKLYLIFLLTWFTIFTMYVLYISNMNEYNKNSKRYYNMINIVASLAIVILILILVLPIIYVSEGAVIYTKGPSVAIVYMLSTLYFAIWIICVFKNITSLNKKFIPIFACIILVLFVVIIQKNDPAIQLMTSTLSLVTILMFFTIENPDLKMMRELELAKNQAEKANRAKSDFLSSMSHEIRTPLNAIVGFSNIIKESNDLDEIHEDASDMVSASNTLLEIVNGILDISKIEADKMEIVEVSYNPLEEFKSLVNLVESRIGEKDIKLRTNFATDLPNTLYGDKGKVKQIITNLLTNAVKYTEKGYIDFKVTCINEKDLSKLTITVSDTGRGIKKEQMDNLFTKFNRLEEDKNTTIEGTGLGLAITKALTEMMGGKVVVDSTYGEGSKFTVFLSQKITNESSLNKEEEKLDNFKGNRVLIVDDNKLNIKVAMKILKEFDLEIDTCESGFECINKIENGESYNAIFMDIMMPKMSGVETLKKLKKIENFNIPVVALTADAIMGKSNKYLEVGFNDYIPKPIDKNKLNNVLNRVLNHIEIDEEVSKDPDIHKIIPITDEQIAELNKLFGEPTIITKEEVEKRNKEKDKV